MPENAVISCNPNAVGKIVLLMNKTFFCVKKLQNYLYARCLTISGNQLYFSTFSANFAFEKMKNLTMYKIMLNDAFFTLSFFFLESLQLVDCRYEKKALNTEKIFANLNSLTIDNYLFFQNLVNENDSKLNEAGLEINNENNKATLENQNLEKIAWERKSKINREGYFFTADSYLLENFLFRALPGKLQILRLKLEIFLQTDPAILKHLPKLKELHIVVKNFPKQDVFSLIEWMSTVDAEVMQIFYFESDCYNAIESVMLYSPLWHNLKELHIHFNRNVYNSSMYLYLNLHEFTAKKYRLFLSGITTELPLIGNLEYSLVSRSLPTYEQEEYFNKVQTFMQAPWQTITEIRTSSI